MLVSKRIKDLRTNVKISENIDEILDLLRNRSNVKFVASIELAIN